MENRNKPLLLRSFGHVRGATSAKRGHMSPLNESGGEHGKPRSRILCVDHHPLIRSAVADLLLDQPDLLFAGEAADPGGALKLIERVQPDLVITGLIFPEATGFDLIKDIQINHPNLALLVYSSMESPAYAEHCLRLGAKGYVCKSTSVTELLSAIRDVLKGHLYLAAEDSRRLISRVVEGNKHSKGKKHDRLSACEFEVLHLIGQGLTNSQIAAVLHRSIKTVETYRCRIKEKLGLKHGIELAQFAFSYLNTAQASTTPQHPHSAIAPPQPSSNPKVPCTADESNISPG